MSRSKLTLDLFDNRHEYFESRRSVLGHRKLLCSKREIGFENHRKNSGEVFRDFREAEFICVCDINKESDATVKDLNDGQINVVHINAVAKNAADDKIRQSLRRFSDSHPQGTRVILISSDVNFASDLSDLRHRKKFDVVLIHKAQVSEALLSCATEHYFYEDLIRDLPDRPGFKETRDNILVIYGYNKDGPLDKIRQLLKMLSNNCGGKVLSIGPLFAMLKFDTPNFWKEFSVAHMSKRQESPSPQRRSGRDRTSSRSFTPDSYDFGSGANLLVPDYRGDADFGYFDVTKDTFNDIQLTSLNNNRLYKTTGGGGYVHQQSGHMNNTGTDGQGNSPSHTHTLPNSKSEKYYSTKSGSSSLENSPSICGGNKSSLGVGPVGTLYGISTNQLESEAYVMGDLSNAASSSGETITVFKAADTRRLADIPIPSFGFRDIPPPSMPSAVAETTHDSNSGVFDPIKLIETASLDSRAFITSQSNLFGQEMIIEHPDSQLVPQTMFFRGRFPGPSNCSGIAASSLDNGSYFTYSQLSAFTKHQSVLTTNNYLNEELQSRSISVPAQSAADFSADKVTAEDEMCLIRGYSPQETFRSHSQNSDVFKMPAPVQKDHKNISNPVSYRRQHSPGSMSGQKTSTTREPPNSASSDGEDRPFSPIWNPSSGRQNFRSHLSSTTSPVTISPSPTNRTPSPLTGPSMTRPHVKPHGSNLYRVPTPAEIGDPSTDYLHPEFNSGSDVYVELIVSNLDYNIHPREWRKIIYATFHPHVKILSIQVRLQADHTSVATVRLPSEHDARFAIAQFHRRKIGYKRINVQYKADCSQSPAESLRMDTIALLMEAKDNKMPLSRIIDLFDKRFHKTVSVSDVYKMRDTVQIMEMGGAGRWVRLQPGIRRSPTPNQNTDEDVGEVFEQPVCSIHCPEGSVYYTEALNACMLPNVTVLRKHFSPQLHSLLLSHNGYIPLMSLPACYTAEFQPIEPVKDGGIPLEHVISCVPGVEITVSKVGVKVIQFQENREQFYDMIKGNSWQELGKISREVMELLRQQPTCTMPVSKFIPTYHHYFGRQCRVADYGYTKLQELFEAIPHAIQILGTGDRKTITLSPRAQLKRFTTDILKVIKAQPAKQILLHEFPLAYEKVMGKPLSLPHYGVSYMEDVLSDIPTTTLIVIEEDNHILLAVPRRDQTSEEVERMKQFSLEVVDLLKHHPQSCMPFNKFIPAYHHHFGRQCRVSDYGFNKLTDLFEAIAHIVEIKEDGEERMIHLAHAELRKVLCEQLTSLIRPARAIPLNKILVEYAKHFGFCLKLEDFLVNSVKELLLKLKNHIKIEYQDGQECATLVKEFHIPQVGLQVMQLLMDESGGSLPVMELSMRYESKFGCKCDIRQIREELSDYVQIDDSEFDTGGIIRLTSQQMLGRNLRLLLLHHGQIPMCDLSNMYREQYSVELSPSLYGFSNLYQLLLSFPHILKLKGKSSQKYIQSAGMLSTPDMLPPSRVDVPTSGHFNLTEMISSRSVSDTKNPSATSSANMGSVSDLLRHASQLWDPCLALQAPVDISNSSDFETSETKTSQAYTVNIMDLLNGKMSTVALKWDETRTSNPITILTSNSTTFSPTPFTNLSPNGVPVAWQMKAGGEKVLNDIGTSPSTSPASKSKKINRKTGKNQTMIVSSQDQINCNDHSHFAATEVDERGDRNSCNNHTHPPVYDHIRQELEDIFSKSNPPLDTSSTRSQHSSSSQSSMTSPAKRKTRIAANFKVSQ